MKRTKKIGTKYTKKERWYKFFREFRVFAGFVVVLKEPHPLGPGTGQVAISVEGW